MARTARFLFDIEGEINNRFHYDLSHKIDDIRDEYSFDVSCQGTLPVAIRAFFEAQSYEDALRNAISVGGDSDTIAAIAGGMAWAMGQEMPSELQHAVYGAMEEDMLAIDEKFSLYCLGCNTRQGSFSRWVLKQLGIKQPYSPQSILIQDNIMPEEYLKYLPTTVMFGDPMARYAGRMLDQIVPQILDAGGVPIAFMEGFDYNNWFGFYRCQDEIHIRDPYWHWDGKSLQELGLRNTGNWAIIGLIKK